MLNKNIFYIFIAIVVITGFLLFSNLEILNSNRDGIQNILEDSKINLEKQLEIKGVIYANGNTYYIKDDEGYKLEIRECSKNRDLTLNEKQTIKGYIFTIENPTTPIFYCGVYNDTEYFQRLESLENRLKQIEIEKQLVETQNKALEEQKIAEQEAAIEKIKEDAIISSEIKEIEDKYKGNLASIPSGTQKNVIETYTWLPPFSRFAKSMEGWTLGGCTGCSAAIYEEVVENKYKVTLIIQYSDDGRTYRGNRLNISVI
jgi:hypothetical protein